jgi:ABC-2 type transport system ATP-binding protein
LLEIGMMREKRRILPHVYYINDQRVLFEHMHVLGYLMFASEQAPGKPESKQREWLNLLLRTGLYPFTLTYIRSLNPAEYALVSALLAYRSAARLVVMDFSHIDAPEQLMSPMAALVQELLNAGKTVVLTSRSRELVQRVCQRASFLIDGTIVAGGSVHALCAGYDKRILTVVTHSAEAAIAALKAAMPSLRVRKTDTGIALYTTQEHAPAVSLGAVVRALETAGVAFSSVNVPESSLEEAFQEVKRAL